MNVNFLSILAIFKNESDIIKEWIDHHIWQGFEHFYLINYGSTDDYIDILNPYIEMGLITLYHLPEPYRQIAHYNTVYNQIKNNTKWLAVIDIDEYFYGIKEPVIDFIKKIDSTTNINIIKSNWYRFGSSNLIKQPSEIRTSFTRRGSGPRLYDTSMKNIVKTSEFQGVRVHKATPIIEEIELVDNINIHLNHYQVMSLERFQNNKMIKSNVLKETNVYNMDYFNGCDDNAVEDVELCNLVKTLYCNDKK